jgi:signal transduction histidine kinase
VSGAGTQLGLAPEGALAKGRSPMAHLLHALNQPLTGLQCSLELAITGPRRTERYLRALRDGLELTARMRLLVEALRELADAQPTEAAKLEPVAVGAVLASVASDLLPVAESRNVRLEIESKAPLVVPAHPGRMNAVIFRLLESAISLAREGSVLQIRTGAQNAQACATISWQPGPAPEYSPFSRSELGLLIAEAEWKRTGAEWTLTQSQDKTVCTIRNQATESAEV